MSPKATQLRVLYLAQLEITRQADFYEEQADSRLARRWLAAVDATLTSMATLPGRGALAPITSPRLAEVRRLSVEGFPNHFLFYRFDPTSNNVTILRMLHGARDLESAL